MFDKVERAQDVRAPLADSQPLTLYGQAGAVGVLLIDNGQCDADFDCGLLGNPAKNGLLEQDGWYKWKDIHIPSGLIQQKDGNRIKSDMKLTHMELKSVGIQYMIDEE